MRIAVISDIHGNCLALDKVLAAIHRQGIERIVCLGDAIQGGVQPAETVERLRQLGCPIVMGNADAWLFTGLETSDNEEVSEQQLAVRAWSLAQLSPADQAFIQQFQATIEITLAGEHRLLCFHGSPHSFDDLIFPDTSDAVLRQFLGGFDATLLTGGHSHTQQLHRLENNARYFNPGSVGRAFNWRLPALHVNPWAEYALVDVDEDMSGITFHRVALDVAELVQLIRASGQPYAEQSIATYQ